MSHRVRNDTTLEKLLFGLIAFVVSFIAIFFVVDWTLLYFLHPPEVYDDELLSVQICAEIGFWSIWSALLGASLTAWLAARYAARLLRAGSPTPTP